MSGKSVFSKKKSGRLLYLYTQLMQGKPLNKKDEAERFGVDEKSIQRDFADLRAFLSNRSADGEAQNELIYDSSAGCYRLSAADETTLSDSEVLAVCKILLESRSLCRTEMEPIIRKLVNACVPDSNRGQLRKMIENELFHYIEPHHQKTFVSNMWKIGAAVQEHQLIRMQYEKTDGSMVERTVQPVGLMFSEYYFYLTAFIEGIDRQTEYHNPDDKYPTIYRIDRIRQFEILKKRFHIPYKDRFEEGEFRRRVQFMIGGRLRKIRFIYFGRNVEAVLDRLPTAMIEQHTDEGIILTAEVFGSGIDMWIRSQGDDVRVIENREI